MLIVNLNPLLCYRLGWHDTMKVPSPFFLVLGPFVFHIWIAVWGNYWTALGTADIFGVADASQDKAMATAGGAQQLAQSSGLEMAAKNNKREVEYTRAKERRPGQRHLTAKNNINWPSGCWFPVVLETVARFLIYL
jgi:hypothetical protein